MPSKYCVEIPNEPEDLFMKIVEFFDGGSELFDFGLIDGTTYLIFDEEYNKNMTEQFIYDEQEKDGII